MNILIPLAKSKIDHIDLKYSLRSIEKYLTGYDEIFIVGEKPKWIKNVKHIPFEEKMDDNFKERNIFQKIEAYFSQNDGNVFFCNDDFFFLQPTDTQCYPFYHKGELSDGIEKNNGTYKYTLIKTKYHLECLGKRELNFDGHCPIVYNRVKFKQAFEAVTFNIRFGYAIKSIYANMNDINGEFMEDVKLRQKYTLEEVKSKVKGRHIISCTDVPLKYGLGEFLAQEFSEKSKYEI